MSQSTSSDIYIYESIPNWIYLTLLPFQFLHPLIFVSLRLIFQCSFCGLTKSFVWLSQIEVKTSGVWPVVRQERQLESPKMKTGKINDNEEQIQDAFPFYYQCRNEGNKKVREGGSVLHRKMSRREESSPGDGDKKPGRGEAEGSGLTCI